MCDEFKNMIDSLIIDGMKSEDLALVELINAYATDPNFKEKLQAYVIKEASKLNQKL